MSQDTPKSLRYVEAFLIVGLAIVGILFVKPVFAPKLKPVVSIPGLIECEDLKIKAKSPNVFFQAQSTKDFSQGTWSKNQHMFGLAYGIGDWIELSLPVSAAGRYRIDAYLTKASDYAIIQWSLDGSDFGSEIDLWSSTGQVISSGKIVLGETELTPGLHTLRLEVKGKNAGNSSPHYFFGIDGFVLEKI